MVFSFVKLLRLVVGAVSVRLSCIVVRYTRQSTQYQFVDNVNVVPLSLFDFVSRLIMCFAFHH